MIAQFFSIFVGVVAPVFSLVGIAYLAGPRLGLEARTLSRAAFYLFIPAFVFDIISSARVPAGEALRMILYIAAVYLSCAVLGYIAARLLRRSREMAAAYVIVAVFGNIGNFGLSLIEFRLGREALVPGTVYFLAVTTTAFIVGVAAANWVRGGRAGAALAVFRTPALLAILPALAFQWTGAPVPAFLSRMTGLLGQAMIPTMLVTLGLHLADTRRFRLTVDVLTVTAVRLVAGPAVGALLVLPFGLAGLPRAAGIMQASMPAAVMTAIIALEYDLAPEFVTHTVLFSTVASFFTLTVVLTLV